MSTPTADQIVRVEEHLRRFSNPLDPPEQLMLDRIKAGEWTEFDQRFFEHELLESDMMDGGVPYEEAHLRVLAMQGIVYQPGYEAYLYQPDIILDRVTGQWFNRAARELAAKLAGREGEV